MKHYKIVNALVYNAGWFVCVGGAGSGYSWPGLAAGVLGLALHLASVPDRRSEAKFLAIAVALGCAMDTAQSLAGTFTFRPEHTWRGVVPWWLVGVWMLFASTFSGCLGFIQGRWVLMAAFGSIGGPLAYYAGARLGAVTMPDGAPRTAALVAIAVAWALAYPALGWLWRRIARPGAEPGAD